MFFEFMDRNSSSNLATLHGLVAIGIMVVAVFLVYRVTTGSKSFVTLLVEASRGKYPAYRI